MDEEQRKRKKRKAFDHAVLVVYYLAVVRVK